MKVKINNSKNDIKVIQMEELSWKKIEELNKEKTIFFLPISPLEEHGPHLPVGTDFLTAKDTANEAIKSLNKKNPELTYILLPAIPLGYCKFNTHGFKYLIICTYHMSMGHLKGIYSGMEKVMRKYDMKICEPWSPYFYNDNVEKYEPKLGFDTSKEKHAGFRETSLMKYQYPYLVDESHKKLQSIYVDLNSPRILGKTFKDLGLKDGYVGSPARADADYGRWYFNETVNVYVKSALYLYEGKELPKLPKNVRLIMKSLFWQ